MTSPTPDLSALITSLQERDAVWKRERTQWPPGISDEAKQHHYAEIGKNVEPHLPSFLALSRWAMEAKEAMENLKKDGAMFSKHDDAVVVALSSFPSIQ